MDNLDSLLIGVISGVISATLIYILLLFLNKIILPWYRQLVYHGVDIEGKWEERLDLENGIMQITTAELKQKAHEITGNVTMVKSKNGEIFRTEMFNLTGIIKDRILNTQMTCVDKKRVSCITGLHEIYGDGTKMRGVSAWYDAGMGLIISKATEKVRI